MILMQVNKDSGKGLKEKFLRLILIKSTIGRKKIHLRTVTGLGLRRLGSVSVLKDTSSVRGMVRQVSYLLHVEEFER